MPAMKNLTDQVIVITGASSGIGAATALACAQAGMNLVLNARRADRLQQVAGAAGRFGRSAEIVVGDVAEPGLSRRLLDAAVTRFGRFDVVFANAGYGFRKPAHRLEMAELRAIFEVNFFAACDLLMEAARRLIAERRPGHLLMCSSAVAKFTMREFGAYSATKAAQNHFCRAMRMELRPLGIEVSSVHPVTTLTEFDEVGARYPGASRPRWLGRTRPGWLVQRPQKVADAVVRCLRRPRAEVWTSSAVRLLTGLMTAFPSLMDLVGSRPR